jgi:PAS domain S-box-containing protein
MEADDEIFREIVEQQQDPVVTFSPEGRLIYVNPAYCELVGKTKEELSGGVFMPVTERQYADVIATQLVKLFRPPHACLVEQWIMTRRGMRCISWSAKSLLDGTGTVRAIIATGRDLTQQKQQEKVVQKRDRELMLVVESGIAMYYTHTPDHAMDYVSPRIRALLGCRPRAGKRLWTDYLTDNPANAAGLERTLRAISSGRREPPYRLELLAGDGGTVWVEVNEIPVVRDGKTVAIAGSLTDVTEKKQVEEGMAEADILIKGSRDPRYDGINSGQDQRHSTEFLKSPVSYLKSKYTKKEKRAEQEEEFEIA